MERKKIIDEILSGSPNRMREAYFIKYHKQIHDEIIKFTRDVNDIPFKFKVWHWVNNNPNPVLCRCGKRVKPKINWQDGFRQFCSTKCSANDTSKIEKSKKTLLERYGVDHYSKTEDYKTKVKETSIAKWGVDNFSKTEEYRQKSKNTYREKWGVDSFTKTEEYRQKSKKTLLQKYGVDSWIKTEEAKSTLKKRMLEKYDVDRIFKNEKFRKENFEIAKNPFYIRYISLGTSEFNCDKGLPHTFIIDTDNYYGRKQNSNPLCTVCCPINKSSSMKEDSFCDWITSVYQSEVIRNYKNSLELDVYLPDISLGFEFNGVWWHSDSFKDKNYHIEKSNHFLSHGIKVVHIWEDDWVNKQEIVKSQILNILKLTKTKIAARKCSIRAPSTKEYKLFLENNHIQGFVHSSVQLGLYYQDELISLMTFDHSEGRKKMTDVEWNLNRFCNKLNCSVTGGASKLLTYFINNYKPKRVISYADRDWSTGNLYKKLGFVLVSETKPDYKYVVNGVRKHKSGFRKSKLKCTQSESSFMLSNGVPKVWDCGKLKFEIYF